MSNNIVTYRGASADVAEMNQIRSNQLQQQQGCRLVYYRGSEGVLSPAKAKGAHAVQYRGAKAELNV